MANRNTIVLIFLAFSLLASTACNQQPTSESPQTAQEKLDVFWGLLGSYPQEENLNPYHLTRDDKSADVGAILFQIRREYRTAADIAQATGITAETVGAKLNELLDCELVRERDGSFIVNFPFWDIPLRDKINELGMDLANQVVVKIKQKLPELEEAFNKSSLPGQGYTWDDMALIIVGGLLLDTGLNDRGLRTRGVFQQLRNTPERPGGYRYWYKAVEGGWGPFWKFGHDQIATDSKDITVGMFYGQLRERRLDWSKTWDLFDDHSKAVLFPLVRSEGMTIEDLASQSQLARAEFDQVIQEMKVALLVRTEDDMIYPNFPIFHEQDISELIALIDTACNEIIDEVYIPFIPTIEDTWSQIAPESWEIENIDTFFIREVFDRPYNLTLHQLVESGILPPSPIEPPFDYWAIKGFFKVV